MTDRDALIVLNMLSGIGPVRIRELAALAGSPAAVLSLPRKDLAKHPLVGDNLAKDIASWEEKTDFNKEVGLSEKAGVSIVTWGDPDYPEALSEIYDPPPCIYVRGKLDKNTSRNIAVVGSRRTSNYGARVARHISESASFAGWTVVSGLAYGIDAIAHKSVVEAGGKTVAVLGGGLARIHPQDHVPLARSIIEKNGAVISEFPMEFSPNKWSFPMRNRIISGLSQGTLVVEAGTRSGSLITAKFALDQGRQVFAVPGEVDNPQARGTNQLIKTGARLTESFDDILEEFEFLPGIKTAETRKPSPADYHPELGNEEKSVLDALGHEEKTIDQLSAETRISPGNLLAVLMKLEIARIVTQLPGKRFRKGTP
ncbi:MAG: DNA-processing protein DprA [Victivallales bacterium]|nr:DNA-processing protein DprA [Victivallales bacterium]